MSASFIVLAGPNGAGKSTFVEARNFGVPILDPDRIARGLVERGSTRLALAGRIVHDEIEKCFQSGRSFGIETTLSGKTIFNNMLKAKSLGMTAALYYVGLTSVNLSKLRVLQRVAKGGHGIPPEDLERRFERTLDNLSAALRIVDTAEVYDNSGEEGFKLVGCYSKGKWSDLDTSVEWLMKVMTKR